ncbi:MAG: PKD domain-containing protein [Candidatus Doudnabacteria bacterium]|jgi:hypothetical protein
MSNLFNKKTLVFALLLGMLTGFLLDSRQKFFSFAQADGAVVLNVESASQITPGSSVDLKVFIDPTASPKQPAGVQWDFAFNTSQISSIVWKSDGPAAADAGKSASCASPSSGVFRCLVFGFNISTINKGALGTITVTLSNTVSAATIPLVFSGLAASDPDGLGVPISATDGTITVKLPQNNTPPSVSITAPASGSTVSGASVSVTAQALASTGTITNIKFYFDNTNLFGNSNSSPFSANWDTTLVSNGAHSIIAVATDSQGLVNTSSPVTLTVNNSATANPPICQLNGSASVSINQAVSFTAGGGNGQFSWSANGGNPSMQMQSSSLTFSTSYLSAGNYTVTLTSNGQTVSCPGITVVAQTPTVSCSASPQSVNINNAVSLTASGGDGLQYSWTVSGGAVTSYAGKSFSTIFSSPGTYTATVSSGGKSGNCSIQVQEPTIYTLVCTASSASVDVNESITFSATGGNAPYNWTGGGSPATGTGNNFSTAYATAGNKTVTVTSHDGQTVHCGTVVNQPVCQPNIGASIIATTPAKHGATYSVNLTWNSNGSNKIKITKVGPGSASSVIVSAGNKSGSYDVSGLLANSTYVFQMADSACGNLLDSVSVVTPALPANLNCSANNDSVNANQTVIFSATGGNTPYNWTGGGSPATGTGNNFSTAYATAGNKTVTVTSQDGQTVTCPVVSVVVETPAVTCSASPTSGKTGELISFTANGGDNNQYSWTVTGGSVINYNGKNFSTTFASPGTYTATVSSGGKNGSCGVQIATETFPLLVCYSSASSINLNSTVTFTAVGGKAPYNWTGGEVPFSSIGNVFNTSYSSAGGKTAVVTSADGQTAQCNTYVNLPSVILPEYNNSGRVNNICVNNSCNTITNNTTITSNNSNLSNFNNNPWPPVPVPVINQAPWVNNFPAWLQNIILNNHP